MDKFIQGLERMNVARANPGKIRLKLASTFSKDGKTWGPAEKVSCTVEFHNKHFRKLNVSSSDTVDYGTGKEMGWVEYVESDYQTPGLFVGKADGSHEAWYMRVEQSSFQNVAEWESAQEPQKGSSTYRPPEGTYRGPVTPPILANAAAAGVIRTPHPWNRDAKQVKNDSRALPLNAECKVCGQNTVTLYQKEVKGGMGLISWRDDGCWCSTCKTNVVNPL